MRTAQEFVEDMASNAKTDGQIMVVAQNTRWIHKLGEVKTELKALRSRFPKKVKKNLKKAKKSR